MTCAALAAIGLHLASLHSRDGYNNINPGISVRSECGLVAGAYVSSQSTRGNTRIISYVGYSAETKWKWPVFGSLALAHGYQRKSGKDYAIVPLPMVGVKTPRAGRFRAVLGYVPSLGPNPHVLHLMVEHAF